MKGSEKNLLLTLQSKKPAHIPIWLMRQAGRYLPEYKELRARAGSFMKLCFTPELASEVTLQPIRRFGMDGAILFSDILVVPYGLGLSLEFVEGEGPKLQRVENAIPVFNPTDFYNRTAPIYETVRLTKKQLPSETTLIGFAGSPWTVACYMLGGKGANEFTEARLRAYADESFFKSLLDVLVEATSFYLLEQINAGAMVLQLFDSWSGLVPAELYQAWVIEPTKAIMAKIKKQYPHIPIIGFPRMSGSHLVQYVAETKVDAVSLDQTISIKQAEKILPPHVVLQGNLDPLLLLADEKTMLHHAEKILLSATRPFIFNLGHGITPQVLPERVGALVKFVQHFK